MRYGKKLIRLLPVLSVGLLLAGCGEEKEPLHALVTDTSGVGDSGINYELWESIVQYTGEDGQTAWYQATADSGSGYSEAMEQASGDQADLIVSCGDAAGNAVYNEQRLHKDTDYLLLDATPTDIESGKEYIRGNTCCIYVDPEQAGFLAGYAATREGYTNLGFLAGDSSDQNIRYGSGYLQGIQYAAAESGLADGSVQVRYRILGNNAISPALEDQICSWYSEGCQVIYACGNAPVYLARSGAESTGNKIIDTDMVNQTADGVVLASAGLNYRQAVSQALTMLQEGELSWGSLHTFGLKEGALGLDMTESEWQNFNQEQYDTVCRKITSGEISVLQEDVSKNTEEFGMTKLTLVKEDGSEQ